MASIDLEYNSGFQIYNSDGTPFHDLVLHKCTYETVVMSLGDKISGILYYKDNALDVTMSEYIIYKGVRYTLVNPPTILREGLVSDNSELRGMTKYSFTFYHPMYVLNNFPFSDIAVQSGQSRYLSQNKTFSWIGTLVDFVAKLNKNLEGTQWMVTIGNVTQEEQTKLSEVLSFDKNTIAEALKRGYETWEVPYVVDQVAAGTADYQSGKRFVVQYGLPTTEILDEYNQPFVFQMGQGVGLKNNSRNPKNNKIITRIAGYGSEDNIPYGYPQIPYYGGNVEYPLYYGIVGGRRVQLIKHPFTRNHLMPSVYSQSVYNKVNPKLPNGSNNPNYNPNIELVDYYDANDNTYTNRIKPNSPSYETHEFGDIKPELGEKSIISAVPVSQQETQPDYKQKSDFLQEILDRISATEIEDEKTELLDVYDRVDRGLSYYEKHGEEGGDTYWFVFSITNDDYYEYVSYESSNYNFTATVLRNGSSAPTPDWDDTMDDDGNYLQSYFKITLPILEFDLYACAAITQEMKINMRSGACIGCTFPVEVDWDDYKRNFYNSDGEFDPDGEQRDYTKYPDSSSGQITVMVKKELETFGTLMPNQYQQPTTGDKFVILGISLPETYITSAEQRLDTDMKQYMRDNNVYYFDYPLKFDEHFLISHEDILSQMKNNVVVRFKYADEEQPKALYIKQMSVKYNESPLPKYDITLTDDIEIVLNQIGQVTDEVSKLRLGFGVGGFGTVGAEYIRKDIDDTARGTIRMIKGMQVGERFVTGLLGEGGVFRKDSDGTTYLETDKLYVRMKAYFDTVEVKHYLHTGGNRIASQASGIVCSRVEMIDAYGGLAMDVSDAVLFRCFFKANDGDKTIRNDFMIGDLAFCRETNVDVSSVNLHGYWRLVVGRNVDGFLTENKEAWIDLSNRASDTITVGGRQYSCAGYQNGSDAPIAQDDIIQLGNITDKDRQGAIVEYVGGDDAPSYQIFQGIGEDLPYPYTLEDKNYIGLGYSSQTGHAYMNVYGDVFIGAKPDSVTGESPTYIKYDSENEELRIKAVVEFVDPDTGQSTALEDFANTVVTDIENIQSQIDGELDTWYYAGVPTLQNAPANQWTTDDDKKMHVGDLYYDKDTGYVYRFIYDTSVTPNVYKWIQIHDDAIAEALKQAERAQDTADHKRRVFVSQPVPIPPNTYVEYDVGDLWTNATGTFTYDEGGVTKRVTYNNDLLRCKRSKPIRNQETHVVVDGSFSIADWELATRYTDDSKIDNFLDGYQGTLTTIRNQVDKKAETYYQDNDPSTNQWGADHVGDMWFCTSNHTAPSKFQKGTTWVWQEIQGSYVWAEAEIPQVVFDTLDGKKAVYVAWDTWYVKDKFGSTVSNLALRDLLIPASDITPQVDGSDKNYYANRMYRCVSLNPISFQEVDYVDNQTWSNAIQQIYGNMSTIEGQVDKKAETWYQNTNPENAWTSNEEKSHHVGDLWLVNIDVTGSQIYKAGTTWYYKDNGVGADPRYTWERQVVPQEVFDYADGKAAIFVGSTLPANYHVNDMWFIGDGVADANLPTGCIAGDVVVSSAESATYNKSHWAKKDRYTDDSKFNGYITQIINGTSDTSDSAQVAQALHVIKAALNENTSIDGGLILTSLISLRSNNQVWAGISGLYDATVLGGGIASWYGGLMKDYETLTDAQKNQGWSVQKWAKSLFRFDGSGYLASGNITWNENGAVTIKNITTLSDSQSTNILNELATFNNAFTFATSGSGSTTVLSITPQVPFTTLAIFENGQSQGVATRKWVSDNYISIAFFNRLFQAYSSTTISDANKVAANDTTTAINNLKLLVGTWTSEYLSALGLNSSGSGSGGGGDVYWSQLSSTVYDANQQIASAHLNSVTNPLSLYFNEETQTPNITYDGRINRAAFGILTKSYADNRYMLASVGVTSVKVNGTTFTPTDGLVDLGTIGGGGTVTSIKVGTTTYNPTNGVVTLPDYLAKTGGTLTGGITIDSPAWNTFTIRRYEQTREEDDGSAVVGGVDGNGLYMYHGYRTTGNSAYMYLRGGYGLGIGCTPQYALDVNGVANASGLILDSVSSVPFVVNTSYTECGARFTNSTLTASIFLKGDRYFHIESAGLTILGQNNIFGKGTGSSEIDINTYALTVGTQGTRSSTAGSYIAGIAFNSLLKYEGRDTYNISPHGWIGLRTVTYSGSELSALVFATKEGTTITGTGNDIPKERMCISPSGLVGIGLTSPSTQLHVNGTIRTNSGIQSYGAVGIYDSTSNATYRLSLDSDGAVGHLFNYNTANNTYSTLALQYGGGRVGIGTTLPAATLHVNGDIKANSTVYIGDETTTGSNAFMVYRNQHAMAMYADPSSLALYYVPTYNDWSTYTLLNIRSTEIVSNKQIAAPSFVVNNGTASQFLKADGTLDSTSYMSTSSYTLSLSGDSQNLISEDNCVPNNKKVGFYLANSSLNPGSDGYIMSTRWHSSNYVTQLFLDVDPTYVAAIRHRKNDGTWVAWKQFAFKDDLSAYLPKTGGDLTGDLSTTGNIKSNTYRSQGGIWMMGYDTTSKSLTIGTTDASSTGDVSIRGTSLTTNANILPSAGSTINIGSSDKYFKDCYLNRIYTRHIDALTGDSYKLYFHYYTNGDTVFSNGNVGIGTNSPTAKLDVAGGIKATGVINITNSGWTNFGVSRDGAGSSSIGGIDGNGVYFSHNKDGVTTYMYLKAGQGLGIGTAPSYALHVNGNAKIGSSNGNFIEIGAVRLVYDSSNNAIKVVANDGTSAANFYATGAVSALGANSSSGGGVGDVTWSALANNADDRQIAASHLNVLSNYVTSGGSQEITGAKVFSEVASFTAGIKMASSITPSTNNQQSIGTSSYYFQNGYITNVYSTTATIGYLNIANSSAPVTGGSSCVKLETSGSRTIYLKGYSGLPIYASGSYSNISDMRYKDVVSNINRDINDIANAPIFDFKWKGSASNTVFVGTSAQYWQKVLPNAVSINPDGNMSLDYASTALAAAIITARRVQNHEDRILELERENMELREEIKQLKAA